LTHDRDISEARALADRAVNYSDALVALVFIGASGLGIALADPDTRGSLNLVTGWMIAGNVIFGTVISFLLVVLRRWELDLRAEPVGESKVGRYSRYFYWARHIVVWISVVQITCVLLLSGLG
jgi:hypothetical protein